MSMTLGPILGYIIPTFISIWFVGSVSGCRSRQTVGRQAPPARVGTG
jgi:hypothetical protein